MCKGAHEAWNNRCPVRKVELSKVKAAYDARQPYHFVPLAKERSPMARAVIDATLAEAAVIMNTTKRGRPSATLARPSSLTPTQPPSRQNSRSKSLIKGRAPKRVYLGNGLDSIQDKNEDTITVEDSQRPRRLHVPSRRALESITTNSLLSSQIQINNEPQRKRHKDPIVQRHEVEGHSYGNTATRPKDPGVRYSSALGTMEEPLYLDDLQPNRTLFLPLFP